SVEGTRNVMNWTELDAAYQLAKSNGFAFRFHVLVWGNQQPNWIAALPQAEQLIEIQQWFDAVATRYPDIDYLEVVNEPVNDPPDGADDGGYINALGGAGTTGWDWVINAFQMARDKFPATTRLVLNEYNVTNGGRTTQYLQIINLLKARNLIDVIGVQAHSFSTTINFTSSATTLTNLNALAATGLPLMVTEMDIDGPTDALQLSEYQRIFPIFWEHPSVIGITLWGYRPGLWRNAEQAYIVQENGTERSAMTWLKSYLVNDPPVIPSGQKFYVSETAANGATLGTVAASDPQSSTLQNWQITGGTGAGIFTVNANTGQLSVANSAALNAVSTPNYTLTLTVSDGRDTSAAATVTVTVYAAGQSTSRLVNIATRAYCSTGNNVTIGGFVISGSARKRVLVRGVGPSLTGQGIPQSEALLDPTIELYKGGEVLYSNDNWGAASNASEIPVIAAQIGAAALAPTDTASSALLVDLDPGVYSFIARGKNGTSGIVLLEVYDADPTTSPSKFVNIATRAYATTGNGVTIGGFVISGSLPKQVLLRAVGPTLEDLGIGRADLLADPTIALYRAGESTPFETNDDWGTNANAALITSIGARIGANALAGSDTRTSALLLTLNPGVYSFIASGKNGASGIVLVEVYDAD
ncbi:MAG TPA: endo-1,4-beta-xylanase, partial [Opitutus sp.]|nr:endo-1,4-beta-xylanase [Opitutus sp.]